MKAELINRLEKLEARHGRASAARRVTLIHIVGVNPDGTETRGGTIRVPPIRKNGKVDFSGFTDDEVRRLARIRIVG
jgi:hypothetical protein